MVGTTIGEITAVITFRHCEPKTLGEAICLIEVLLMRLPRRFAPRNDVRINEISTPDFYGN